MRKNLKSGILASALILFGSVIWAESTNSLEKIVNPKYLEEFKKTGLVRLLHESENVALELVPECSFSDDCKLNPVQKIKGNYAFVSESLFLVPKSEIKEKSKTTRSNYNITDVSIIFRSISEMEGMDYYSINKKKFETLYKNAYTMDNPVSRKRVSDPKSKIIDTNGYVYYAFLNDCSFGKCLYKNTIKENTKEGSMFFEMKSTDPLSIGPISAVEAEKMVITGVAVDCGDSFVLYLKTDSDSIKIPGIKKTMTNSISARMDAMRKWFVSEF